MRERPNSRRNLDLAIERLADSRDEGLRLRRIFANTIVAQMMPHGAVKGGSAMRIRFGYAATRFSTDLDTARAEVAGSTAMTGFDHHGSREGQGCTKGRAEFAQLIPRSLDASESGRSYQETVGQGRKSPDLSLSRVPFRMAKAG